MICVPIDGLIRLDKWLIRLNPYWPHAVAKFCGNVELCRHTALVVFSDPYRVSQYNHWTSPYLDQDAKAVQEDNLLKLEVSELKSKYYMIRTNFSLYVFLFLTEVICIALLSSLMTIYIPVGSVRGPKL